MVAEKKKEIVKRIAELTKKYNVVGVVNLENLPAPQYQSLREILREKMVMLMSRKTLMKKGLETSKKENVNKLIETFRGMPALIFTNENPFALAKLLDKNKSSAPAKGGQEAPNDIVVKAGPTSFAPGPIISELSELGIKSGIEGGKVAVKQDTVVVKEGEVISQKAAGLLKRMDITPMEIGLNLVAVLENGSVMPGKILKIDEEEYKNNIINAFVNSKHLAMSIAYPTKDTIQELIIKAFRDTKALGTEANIYSKDLIGDIIAKTENISNNLSKQLNLN